METYPFNILIYRLDLFVTINKYLMEMIQFLHNYLSNKMFEIRYQQKFANSLLKYYGTYFKSE